MTHLWHASVGAPGAFETENDDRVEYHRTEGKRAFNAVGRLLLPWYKQWKDSEGKELARMWREFKEREKNPEYAAWLKSERKRLGEMSKRDMASAKALESAMADLKQQRAERQRQTRQRRRHARS